MTANHDSQVDLRECIHRFVVAAQSNELTEDGWAEFEQVLCESDDACRLYAEYMDMSLSLSSILDAMPVEAAPSFDLFSPIQEGPVSPPAPSVLGSAIGNGTLGFFSSDWRVAYLVATVIFGIGLVIGSHVGMSRPEQAAGTSGLAVVEPGMEFVGKITGMVDCKWTDAAVHSERVRLGQKYALASGLLEITYKSGAKIILQGPCNYQVESPASGFLSIGKLTAKVDKKEEQGSKSEELPASRSSLPIPRSYFCVQTPTATVTDLGTEFGVEVSQEGTTTSHVFRGSVWVQVLGSKGKPEGDGQVLRENESARVENNDGGQGDDRIIVVGLSAEPAAFIREIPKRTTSPSDRSEVVAFWQFDGGQFLADSSGNGHALVNRGAAQVDGAASFDGAAMMSSVDSIDLTPYTKVRVSWRQRVASAASQHVVWQHDGDIDHSNQDNYRSGMIVVYLAYGKGYACIYTGDSGNNVVEEWNKDQFPVACDIWEDFAVEYDCSTYRASVVKVFKDGKQIATESVGDGFSPRSFLTAVFRIGAAYELAVPFVGQIDDLKIEGATVKDRR